MLVLLEIIYPALMVFSMMMVFGAVLVLNNRLKRMEDKLIDRQIGLSEVDYAIQKISKKVNGLATEIHHPVQSAKQPKDNVNYKYASKMLQSGGKLEEIIETCQLSRGEAELLSALNAKQS